MSLIALYDRDFVCSDNNIMFNLQLMKLANYHRARRDMVSFITDLTRAPYYTKVYYRQNNPWVSFPSDLYSYDNIDIGGYAVNPTYEALPEEAENQLADYTLYDRALQKRGVGERELEQVKQQRVLNHYQLSYDGQHISEYNWRIAREGKSLGPNGHFFIHDNNILPYEKEFQEYLDLFYLNTTNKRAYYSFQFPVILHKDTIVRAAPYPLYKHSAPITVPEKLTLREAPAYFSSVRSYYSAGLNIHFAIPQFSTTLQQCDCFIYLCSMALIAQAYGQVFAYTYDHMPLAAQPVAESLQGWNSAPATQGKIKLETPLYDFLQVGVAHCDCPTHLAWREMQKMMRYRPELKRLLEMRPIDVLNNKGVIRL